MSRVSQISTVSSESTITNPAAGGNVVIHKEVLPLLGAAAAPPEHPSPTATNTPSSSEPSLIRVRDLPAPHTGSIRILELNNPTTRNAISCALLTELRREINAIHSQYDPLTGDELPHTPCEGAGRSAPTRALIIASALDSVFCAGADLKERRGFSADE